MEGMKANELPHSDGSSWDTLFIEVASLVTDQEQVSIILAGSAIEYESIRVVASSTLVSLELLVELLTDCETRNAATSVTGQSSKPVTIEPNASDGGLLLRWGSFGPRKLARFKELLEKPARLTSGWPNQTGPLLEEIEGTVGMSKEEFEQRWARKSLREMLSDVEVRVGKLEESIEDVKKSDNAREESIEDMKEQFRDFVTTCLTSQRDNVQELLDSQRKKLTERNNAFEAIVKALKEETMATTLALNTRIEELEGELALCRAAMGEGVSSAALSNEYIPKLKEFVGTRMENYFRAKGRITDKRQGEIGTWEKFQCELKGQFYPEFAEEEAREISNVTEREAMLAFQEGLKPWVRQEVEQRGIQKLSEAMKVAVSVVKLGLGKDKLGSSKPEGKGICEGNHKDYTDEYGNNGGNGKPRVGKKKPKRKRDKLKCFLCDGPHILKKCPMKSALRKKLVSKALGLGSSARGVEAKEAESEKKPVECFLCHGPHRLRKCPRKSVINGNDQADTEPRKLGSSKRKAEAKRAKRNKSVIEGNDGADKEPKKLGSSKGKAEAKRAKRSKKKRVKCFLCRGPHELQNSPKESSEGLPPKGEVSLSSNLEEEIAIKTVKLGPMRLESSEASELAESSTRLPPMGEVGGASDFKEKEVMYVGQLTRVNAKVHSKHSDSALHSNLCTWQEHKGPFEVLEQGG
ncbi:hypothetical protein PVK06_019533 [Gossypium arboreum]|uniref:Retrotransposon gag domain-containing protein n=1 Tax=Gossypium arboreum TaxID=29729 RepID=A0ABR0PJZ4_GOSAR|nr:hypothetical protein PVK06_019533 [Gossypium arboreum]